MKLATYNVNGIRARLPRLLEWLEREKPAARAQMRR
jgi:exodeoxyribonuclease-3